MLRIRARLLGTARQTLKGSFADIGKTATSTATVFPQTAIDVFSEKTDQRHLQQENKQELQQENKQELQQENKQELQQENKQELQQQNKDLFLQEKKRDLQREKRDLQQTEIKQDLFLHNKTVFQEEADFTTTFAGIASAPFSDRIALLLGAPIPPEDIEVKPDGLLYLPEIRYRRILNTSFGPGGWGLVPRGPHSVIDSTLTREYALFCDGRFVAQARGEQDFFSPAGLPTATEGCKSNAMMRCCKDLGIAWQLWDPAFIRSFKQTHVVQVWGVHVANSTRKLLWRRTDAALAYPYREAAVERSISERSASTERSTEGSVSPTERSVSPTERSTERSVSPTERSVQKTVSPKAKADTNPRYAYTRKP